MAHWRTHGQPCVGLLGHNGSWQAGTWKASGSVAAG